MEKMLSLFNRVVPTLSARLVQLFFGFVLTFVLANRLAPNDLGQYYIQVAIAIAGHFVLLNGLHFPIQRMLPEETDARKTFLSSIFLTSLTGLFSTLALSFVLKSSGLNILGISFSTIFICIAFGFSETFFSQITNITSAFRQSWAYCAAVILRSVGIFVFFMLDGSSQLDANTAMLYFICGNLLAASAVFTSFTRYLRPARYSLSQVKQLVVFSGPYSLSHIFSQTIVRGDRILVGLFLGTAAAGEYSVATDLARRVMTGLCVNARLVFVRDAVDAYTDGNMPKTEQTLYGMMASVLILGIPTACVLAIFGTPLIGFFLPDNITSVAQKMLVIVPFAFVLEALKTYVLVLPFELSKQRWLDTRVAVLGACVFVPTFIMSLQAFGVVGAAIALCITHASIALYAWHLSSSRVGLRQNIWLVVISIIVASCGTAIALNYSSALETLTLQTLLPLAILCGLILLGLQAGLGWLMRHRMDTTL